MSRLPETTAQSDYQQRLCQLVIDVKESVKPSETTPMGHAVALKLMLKTATTSRTLIMDEVSKRLMKDPAQFI